ncbi:hypothetical protein L3049_00125 [Labilibaculum sp. DW002]|uniref:DUF4177 domain-containing protein n=1 Tax=Paralabilibaculum antarcticum TaxID=2912572 RepID=A0ABT5VLT6_9BACT|nr:hypothetical protein [Labilibaculum sp. DW002]MDE5416391.1 hypothetical protein [Labilibaculum sp. DW002]
MKKLLFIAFIALAFVFESNAQSVQYKVITSVESIVPMGLGRSRIVEEKSGIDAENFTTERTDGKKSKQKDVKRSDAKVSLFAETKLLNFYSIAGINFQNIASNDALISSKINTLVADGWELAFVTSAVESDSGKGDGKGIFITRYIFKKVN